MVNMRTGEMVGIDFGHAFGSATTVCKTFLYYEPRHFKEVAFKACVDNKCP